VHAARAAAGDSTAHSRTSTLTSTQNTHEKHALATRANTTCKQPVRQ
jgi:hypothetical protein